MNLLRMHNKEQFLVVISVVQGRNFPNRPSYCLVTEAKFDGEQLSTDPVDHKESPEFIQELAWELDKKSLHQHRLQRSSIKVQVFAEHKEVGSREAVGFVVLDLRSAHDKQTPKWYPLLHSKYSKKKPEVRLSMYIDADDGAPGEPNSSKAQQKNANGLPAKIDSKQLQPMLNSAEGFYQIGPKDSCTDFFKLSVTIAYGANLTNLIPSTMHLPSTGFFFYYSVLGNDVTNEVFYDLLTPVFPIERASVKLRTGYETLCVFLSSQPGIEIHLCCGNQSLGSACVPLKDLLQKDSTEIFMKPITREGSYPLHPPSRTKDQLPEISHDMQPVVGVSLVLRKEDTPEEVPTTLTPINTNSQQLPGQQTPPPKPMKQPQADTPPVKLPKSPKGAADTAIAEENESNDHIVQNGNTSELEAKNEESVEQNGGQEEQGDPRQTMEYKKALELELWLESRKQAVERELKLKEQRHLKALTEEFAKRNTEREVIHRKKVQEVQKLEDKLSKTLGTLEKREKQLATSEHEMNRQKKDLQKDYEMKQKELTEASRRMKEDFEHKVHLEKARSYELEEQIRQLKSRLHEQEAKHKSLDAEFSRYKEQQSSKPEVRLQAEINMLTIEKVELERKLDLSVKSKNHYKQQWGKALKELAKLKQKEQDLAKSELRKQQQELEHMRLRYLAAEEKEVSKSERKELEQLKDELQQLSARLQGPHPDMTSQLEQDSGQMVDSSQYNEDLIARLIEEKNSLLRTGVYTTDDKIIMELDRQINEAMTHKEVTQMMGKMASDKFKE